jgi:hypothetical protein
MLRALGAYLAVYATMAGSWGCHETSGNGAIDTDAPEAQDSETGGDAGSGAETDEDTDTTIVESCHFDYEAKFAKGMSANGGSIPDGAAMGDAGPGASNRSEPDAPYTYGGSSALGGGEADLVLPGYDDDMPLFERGATWIEETRCYELPYGGRRLTQDQAYDLYRDIAELTTGVPLETGAEVRTVLGIRGAYPGTFQWNGNAADLFNDTIVLLWVDAMGEKNAREFSGHTDVGAFDFGPDASSSLRPNRRYRYANGWHGENPYSALQIAESGYRVRNDTNANGHWDDDRNGWLPPEGDDFFRTGRGHNLHVASVNGPLGSAHVAVWSAGCQVIPGMASWEAFISAAWTGEGDQVSYFLVDARDIPSRVWYPCDPDGSHACPFDMALPAVVAGDTSASGEDAFDRYNCSAADESGPEMVYTFTTDGEGALNVTIDCEPPVDLDVHLLDADDENACLARGHESLTYDITPGRYLIIADTFVDGGSELAGEFTLSAWIE